MTKIEIITKYDYYSSPNSSVAKRDSSGNIRYIGYGTWPEEINKGCYILYESKEKEVWLVLYDE